MLTDFRAGSGSEAQTQDGSKCGESKNLSEFHRSSTNKDGRASRCRACRSQDSRAYAERRARAERIAEERGARLLGNSELEGID